ncbi:HU family DNA-binding protein [Microbacter margulisiae]|uniref:Nucleoid DNA-binding protein/nucleoid-associated protein YgaU n=1 Tax=Microbacter margulisiae TaxID=1350067 RepID=A0A7W5DS85_9PORP|nr:HU family DNA-binding protein [Microbacter margulisiae]MBB3187951.1 nucleoid DNA-binding protein/nucleoid-associated protein YgaU [Microbacter margulisiae]
MSNEKKMASDIATLLAQQQGITKKAATAFVQQLFSVIYEALLRDKEVKVKGLGVFKIEWHQSRMSVNVQTGEKYEIAGHNKITFVPDKAIRDVVNQPFEHLDPVVLDQEEGVGSDTWMEDEELRMKRFSDQAEEIMSIICDLQQISPHEAPVIERETELEQPAEILVSEIQESEITSAEEPEETLKEDSKGISEEELKETEEPSIVSALASTPEPETAAAPEIMVKEHKQHAFFPEEEPIVLERMRKETPRNVRRWIVFSVVLAFLVVVCVPIYYVFFIMNRANKVPLKTSSVQSVQPVNSTNTLAKNSFQVASNPKIENISPKSSNAHQIKKSGMYNDTLTVVTFTEGSRLTLLALKYYGSKLFWVYIYAANKQKIANPDHIGAGMHILIPKLSPKLIDVHNPQCLIRASALQTKYKEEFLKPKP